MKIVWQPKEGKHSSNYITPPIHATCSRHVKSFSNIRIDLLHAQPTTFVPFFSSTYSITLFYRRSHECLCIKSLPPTPKPTKPSNHKNISSRHVKSFSNIRVGLLCPIWVTFPTSHLLMSPLKLEAITNVTSIFVTLLTSHILMSPLKDRIAT
jgi:hypothetical protein